MVEQSKIEAQLQKIGFNIKAWGRQEVRELPNVILPDEEIYECVNGIYEGGFALLVATDVRVLLIDKKPLNYLTVEDLRFDMINEIDYNHRALGAYVDITTGNRELKFRSYNQQRLRNLISHVQRRMAEIKRKQDSHQEGQNQHLEQINQHLRTYLMAQYKHQEDLQRRLNAAQRGENAPENSPEPPRPSPELSDYLLAQGLLEEHEAKAAGDQVAHAAAIAAADFPGPGAMTASGRRNDLLLEGLREVFGDKGHQPPSGHAAARSAGAHTHHPFDINPLRIAYSKLPMAMRNRKFGRPSLHAHSQAVRQKEEDKEEAEAVLPAGSGLVEPEGA